jgi:RHS repeat-associated protein
MKRNATVLYCLLLLCGLLLFAMSGAVSARYVHANPPCCKSCCCDDCGCECQQNRRTPSPKGPPVSANATTGQVCMCVPVFSVGSNSLDLSLFYNSDNADGSRGYIDARLGYGWTHSHNQLLFTQRGHMFLLDGRGQVTRYQRTGRTTYSAGKGEFQTLERNLDGSFTLIDKDESRRHFEAIPGDTLRVSGRVFRLVRSEARNDRVTEYDYDGSGRLTDIRDASFGYHITLTHRADGQVASITDAHTGRTLQLHYDSTGRKLLEITEPPAQPGQQPKTWRFSYNVDYQITAVTDRNGERFTVGYRNDKPVSIKAGNENLLTYSNPTNWAIDELAVAREQMRELIPSTTTQRDANGNTWQVEYDINGFVTKSVAPDGATSHTTYDDATLLPETETDANGNTTSYEYDGLGNLTKETDAKGFFTTFEYGVRDPAVTDPDDPGYLVCRDQLSKATYPNGSVTVYEYDISRDANGLHRCNRIKETRDDGGLNLISAWEYDDRGLMTLERDPNGHETTHDYDTAGNRIKTTDAEANATRYAYDDAANRTCMVDGNGHVTVYEYDALDRLIRETAKIGTVIDPTDPIGPACTPADADDIITAEYEYDGNDNQTLVRRQSNTSEPREWQVTTYEYDDRHRLVKETQDPGGLDLMTTYAYDGNDNRIATTDPRGLTTTFEYDDQNRLTKVTDALIYETGYSYDPVGNRIEEIDANGHRTCSQYDELNRLTVQIRKMGPTSCALAASDDLVTRHFYDSGADISCDHDPGSPQCDGPMPGGSNIASMIDPEGKVTYYKYDKLDRRWITIRKVGDTADACDPAGDPNEQDWCEYTKYDPADNVVARIDANDNRTDMVYYDNDWLLSETQDPGGLDLVTSYTYDGAGNVATVTTPRGNVIYNTYDERDQLVKVEDIVSDPLPPYDLVAAYAYDGIGNRVEECDGNLNCTGYSYDAVNRLIDIVDPMGETALNDYDPNGNLTKVTDREGHVTCHYYDAINRRTRTAELMGGTNCALLSFQDIWTDTEYDGVGNVTRLITARLNSTPGACKGATPPDDCQITAYDYDEADRLVLETYADETTREFSYDKAGNLTDRIDQLGEVTLYAYNDLYYLMLRDYQDPAEPDDSFEYDIGGRMTVATKDYPAADPRPDWVVTFDDYDAVNRLLQTTQDATGVPMVVGYSYDTPNGLRDLVYPGGRYCLEQHDLRERLVDVTCDSFDAQYAYDLGNRVETRDYTNGVTATYTYNANDWITDLVHALGATEIVDFHYDYDREGNKRYEEKSPAFLAGQSEAYAYDDIYRLIEYKVGNLVGSDVPVPITQRQYDLDKVGNWDQFTVDDDVAGPGVPVDYNNTPNVMNEYDEDGPEDGIPDDFKDDKATPVADGEDWGHDDNGNRIYDGKRSYVYDHENRLIGVTYEAPAGDLVSEYRYDALGRRVFKQTDITAAYGPTTVTRYAYDDARAIEEQDAPGNTLATYVYGNYIDEVLSMQRGGADFYYHQNALWSVAAVTDAAGNPVERYAYTDYGCPTITDGAGGAVAPNAWGTAHSAIGNPYMFTGRRWDEESGLYYYRARHYDCESGRFLQMDPEHYADGPNMYEFVVGNPANRLDPLGTVVQIPFPPEVGRFVGLLGTLCPAGKWAYVGRRLVSGVSNFCKGRVVKTPCDGTFRAFRWCTRAKHPISCCCICDAINDRETVQLISSRSPGGYWRRKRGRTTPYFVVVGTARPGYAGHSDPALPNTGLARATPAIILAHELCCHHVPRMGHPRNRFRRYNERDPVIRCENRIRAEHGWGHRVGSSEVPVARATANARARARARGWL